jgi:hypothetical protein
VGLGGVGEGAPEHRSERPQTGVSEERKAQRTPAPSQRRADMIAA